MVFLWIYIAYFFAALTAALSERFIVRATLRCPCRWIFVILAVFLYFTPSVTAFWFLFLFSVFALANARQYASDAGISQHGACRGDSRGWRSSTRFDGKVCGIGSRLGWGRLYPGLGMGFLAHANGE